MKLFGIRNVLLLVVCVTFTAISAMGAPITITNPSFEDSVTGLVTPCGTGCGSGPTIPVGWTAIGSVGLFQPGTDSGIFDVFDYVPDGLTVAFGNGGTISQVIENTVVEDVTYILQVDLGRRKDGYFEPNSTIALVIGGTNFVLASGTEPTPGNWSNYTASYTGTAEDAGKSIGIVLRGNLNSEWIGFQSDWDNVRLDTLEDNPELTASVAAPEPESIQFLFAGIAGLAFVAARARGKFQA